MSESDVRHLIAMHEKAIANLKLEITPRPIEPECHPDFPPVIAFRRPMPGYSETDPVVETPFVALRYSNGVWFMNRGAGAPSGPCTWDELLDWIGADFWTTITILAPGAIADPEPKYDRPVDMTDEKYNEMRSKFG